MPDFLHHCAAPAKLNLFLHVTGRRADGYHLLQSVFQLIDLCDELDFDLRDDGRIVRTTDIADVPADADLTVRAARLLQAVAAERGIRVPGADIAIHKRLPMGGGIGGGSSDAATTLIVLNHLWQAGFSRAELMRLGLIEADGDLDVGLHLATRQSALRNHVLERHVADELGKHLHLDLRRGLRGGAIAALGILGHH